MFVNRCFSYHCKKSFNHLRSKISINFMNNNYINFEQKRNFGDNINLSSYMKPILIYGSDSYITQALQSYVEVLQSNNISPVTSFVIMGLSLRVATFPAHYYAEKLLAKRLHVVSFLTQNILKKLGDHYGLKIIRNESGTHMKLNTNDPTILKQTHEIVTKQINEYAVKNGLQRSRILNLKTVTVPIWFFSSFAIRNLLYENEYKPVYQGFLWLSNLTDPDPYYIIPICVGLLGFFNIYSQRIVFPRTLKSQNFYDAILVFLTLFAVKIMTLMPACIPIYWFTVSATGIIQNVILRNSKIKKLLGINRLPTDSSTPFRDLFLLRKNRGGLPPSIL